MDSCPYYSSTNGNSITRSSSSAYTSTNIGLNPYCCTECDSFICPFDATHPADDISPSSFIDWPCESAFSTADTIYMDTSPYPYRSTNLITSISPSHSATRPVAFPGGKYQTVDHAFDSEPG